MTGNLKVLPSAKGRHTRVLSIASGKGGVGKTHTAVNLALALRERGKRVLVLDADFGLANFNIMLGVAPIFTIRDYLDGTVALSEVVYEVSPGFSFIPGSSGVIEVLSLSWEQRRAMQFELEELAADFDYLIIDTPAGLGDDALFLTAAAGEVLVVVTPEPTSLTDAYAFIKVLSRVYSERRFSVVVNATARAIGAEEADRVFNCMNASVEKFLGFNLNYLGYIPCDPQVSECILSRNPIFCRYPNGNAGRALRRLAKRIEAVPSLGVFGGGIRFFFEKFIEASVS